jgi:hypothetical protein
VSRRLNVLVDDMLSELESEMESESFAASDAGVPFSCSGWESDPQSFSITAARAFCKDAFNVTVSTADTVTCTGTTCIVRFSAPGGWPVFNITVDMSQVPGLVTVSGTADPMRMRQQICSYSYFCDVTGSINFTRSGNCRTT